MRTELVGRASTSWPKSKSKLNSNSKFELRFRASISGFDFRLRLWTSIVFALRASLVLMSGKYIMNKLAQRASTSGQNWPEGPLHQDQTGQKGHCIRAKLVGRTSLSQPNGTTRLRFALQYIFRNYQI